MQFSLVRKLSVRKIHWKYNLSLIHNSSAPNIDWKSHVLLILQSLAFLPRTRAVPDQKQPCLSMMQVLKGNLFWITTPKHEGTFGGVIRELLPVMFGADLCSVSVTDQRQGGV